MSNQPPVPFVGDADRPAPWRFLLAGAAGGLLSGAFGVGGGVIMVPLLLLLTRLDERRAAATSLAAIVPASLAGVVTYALRGDVAVLAAVLIAGAAMGGSAVGTRILRRVRIDVFRWLLVALLVAAALQMFLTLPQRDGGLDVTWTSVPGLLVLGLVTGVLSGLFGIGGGIVIVPVLVALFGASDLLAKGTSLLVIVPTALTGTVFNVRHGLVEVRDGLTVGLAAAVASTGGALLAGLLAPRLATALFAALLLVFAVQLVARALRGRRAGGSG